MPLGQSVSRNATRVGLFGSLLAFALLQISESKTEGQVPVPQGCNYTASYTVTDFSGARVVCGKITITYAGESCTVHLDSNGNSGYDSSCTSSISSASGAWNPQHLPGRTFSPRELEISYPTARLWLADAEQRTVPNPLNVVPDRGATPTAGPSSKDNSSGFAGFFESPGGAALITAFLGLGLGGFLTNFYQIRAKSREIESNRDDAARQRRFQSAQLYAENQIKIITDILNLVTSCVSNAENLIWLVSERLKDNGTPQRTLQRERIIEKFNTTADSWKTGREILGVTLGTFVSQDSEVFRAWTEVRGATTALLDKSSEAVSEHITRKLPPRPNDQVKDLYRPERNAIEQAVSRFSDQLLSFRKKFAHRHGLLDPDEMPAERSFA